MERLNAMRSRKLSGPVSLANILKTMAIFSLIVAQEDLRDRYAYKVLHETRTYP